MWSPLRTDVDELLEDVADNGVAGRYLLQVLCDILQTCATASPKPGGYAWLCLNLLLMPVARSPSLIVNLSMSTGRLRLSCITSGTELQMRTGLADSAQTFPRYVRTLCCRPCLMMVLMGGK